MGDRNRVAEAMNLVYAYGCAEPLSGWREAEEEMERCRWLWDQCVLVEREIEHETIQRAAQDSSDLFHCIQRIESLSRQMDDAKGDDFARLRSDRRAQFKERNRLLLAWRKEHRDVEREIELERRRRIKALHQAVQETTATDPSRVLYWCNANRIINDYETARRAVKKFGRRLRLSSEEEERGVLTVQIQRTRTGLGAAPSELQDGTFGGLQIGRVDSSVYGLPRARRTKGCKTILEMRVDASGNTIRIPVWLHRPLPDCRVKLAQLVWRREGGRLRFRLCLTLSLPDPVIAWTNHAGCAIAFRCEDRAGLVVGEVGDSSGPREVLRLDAEWTRRGRYCELLKADLQAEIAGLREPWRDLSLPDSVREALYGSRYAPPPYRLHELLDLHIDRLPTAVRAWRDGKRGGRARYLEWQHLRRKLLGHRTEQYRRIARDLASRYGLIVLPDTDLSRAARTEDRDDWSAEKWACLHDLRKEIKHQAGKVGGCVVEVTQPEGEDAARRMLASGLMLAAQKPQKEKRMARHERRRMGKKKRSETSAEVIDS